jgi:hypothetical protein
MALRDKSLMTENLLAKKIQSLASQVLEREESIWLKQFNIPLFSPSISIEKSIAKSRWHI